MDPFPVRLWKPLAGDGRPAGTRKYLLTHLSTVAVDFFETHGMKYLAHESAAEREFLEHYKCDASGHGLKR